MSFQNADSEEGKTAELKASDDSQQPVEQTDKLAPEPGDADSDADKPEYATGLRLFLVMFTMNMSGLLTALEIGIIATAIPSITDTFHALDDTGWYGSATFLVTAATSGVWGKAYKYFHVKYVYLAAIAIFLIGSIVVATAPNSIAVIIGRAIQGLGITGAMNGSIIVINYISHPSKHPMLIGIWMGIFMVSTVLGPIIGGALTSGVSWRWCFYINLPLGVPIVVLLLLFLHIPKHIKPEPATWKEIFLQLDLPGFSIILTSLVCFTLALQWGGQSKVWNNGSVIATLVVWIILTIAFVIVEKFQTARAMIPIRLIKPRVVWANALWSFM
jgi:MFS family permease